MTFIHVPSDPCVVKCMYKENKTQREGTGIDG